MLSACERRRVEAEALESAQQVEAAVLALGFGMDDLGQLVGQRHLPPDRSQVVDVPGALVGEGKRQRAV